MRIRQSLPLALLVLLAAATLAVAFVALPAAAQESANFKLTEHVLNAGGHPSGGVVMASTSFKVTLDALGDSVVGARPSSESFRMNEGFAGSFLPPGEVRGLVFIDKDWLSWGPERSAGDYNVYRDDLCLWWGISDHYAPDTDVPLPGSPYFYLVTVENLLDEEGTKGFDSEGNERPNNDPCP